jgi:hypothetical protein
MEKLTAEEIAEIAEKGRLLFLAAKGKLEPQDYAAYYIYKRQQNDLVKDISEDPKRTSPSDDESPKNQAHQATVSSSQPQQSSSSSLSLSSKGKYVRKSTLVIAAPVPINDMGKWMTSLLTWLKEKIENLNKDYILYEIMNTLQSEIISIDQPPEKFSEHIHNLIYGLFWASKRVLRQKGTVHTQTRADAESKRKEASRKEFISILNESILFFDRSSPTSTEAYRERINYLVSLIIKSIFHGCYPIIKLDEMILKEIKEAHKNSSAAYRRFTNAATTRSQRVKDKSASNTGKRSRQDFEDSSQSPGAVMNAQLPVTAYGTPDASLRSVGMRPVSSSIDKQPFSGLPSDHLDSNLIPNFDYEPAIVGNLINQNFDDDDQDDDSETYDH